MSLTSTQKLENNIVEMEIAVNAEELKAATDKVYKRKVKTITVPGFRKGKAPRQIIERMYGEGIFLEDAVNDLYPTAYSAAVEEAGIDPVDRADVEILKLDKETGFTFKAKVTVKPEVSVSNYKGIEAVKTIATVADSEVDSEIERVRDRNARIVTVEDRAAQDGDETVIDFEGFIDGKAFDGGKGEDYNLTLGTHSFIDTFEDQIIGHKSGESFDVNVTFPEEYHAEELKGKPALFKVTLKEIKGKELPELDDEFAKDVSEFDTLDEYKADIRAKLQEAKDKQNQDAFENALVDKVIENLEGNIPECMYENQITNMVQDFEYRLSSQGMNLQLYLQYTGMDMEAFRKSFRDQAERQVKIRLALEKIVELENIEVTEQDLEQEFARVAEMYSMEVDKVKEVVAEKDLAADLKTNKAIDLIREAAKVTEAVEADKEEKPAKKPAAKKTPAKKPAAKKASKKTGEDTEEEKPKKTAKKVTKTETEE